MEKRTVWWDKYPAEATVAAVGRTSPGLLTTSNAGVGDNKRRRRKRGRKTSEMNWS